MERRDAFVAGAGAIIVAIAVLGAALQGTGALADYRLVYELRESSSDLRGSGSGGALTFAIPGAANLTEARAEVTVTATGAFTTGVTAHVTLRAPNGTTAEADGSGGPGSTSFVVRVALPASPRPANATVQAASLEDAQALLAANGTTEDWSLEVQVAATTPTPQPFAVRAQAFLTTWSGRAEPAPPPGGR